MDELATREFGENYTLKTICWNDGDFRIIAYNLKKTARPENEFVELWYQDSEWEHEDAALKVYTVSEDADASREETRQTQVGETEWVEFPDSG